MSFPLSGSAQLPSAEELGREFFAALDARDPQRLRATLADYASFRALPHRDPIRPADEILAYFGAVVTSYPAARWEVTDVIGSGDRAAIQYVFREHDAVLDVHRIAEQVLIVRAAAGRIVGMVGYYDSQEFQRLFWGSS